MFTNGPTFLNVGDKIDGELSTDRRGRFVVLEVRANEEPPVCLLVGITGGRPFKADLAELERQCRLKKVIRKRAQVVSYAPQRGRPRSNTSP